MTNFSVNVPGIDYAPDAAPATVRDHPAMMSRAEKSLLYLLARDAYAGEGSIVDAGLFMGASTAAFASGLRRNPRARDYDKGKPIQSYDIALWVEGMEEHLAGPQFAHLLARWAPRPGQSFEPLLRHLLSGTEDLVDLHIGDIVVTAGIETPVAIAFYDCLKTFERDKAVFAAFAPHYIPGTTIVIQQDYFYDGAPDHRIRQEFLSPYFTYHGFVGCSAIFRVSSPIPEVFFREDPIEQLDVDTKLELLAGAARRPSSPYLCLLTRLSGVRYALSHAGPARARALLDEIRSEIDETDPKAIGSRLPKQVASLSAAVERAEKRAHGRPSPSER